jgi:iron complex outermembrane receptor protein
MGGLIVKSARQHLVSTTAAASCALAFFTTSALAQNAPAKATGSGIEQVVVTARKRSERLQKVPISVTALSATQLAQNKVTTASDLGQIAPSLTFEQSSYSTFGDYIGIRGQKTTETLLSETPSVGVYIDDVYQPGIIGTGLGGFNDVSQVEVLKGPQGTLYGRNTTGGALKVATRLPDYSGFYGSVLAGFGNYSSNEDQVMLNVPLVKDEVALRVDFEREYHGGFAYDHTNNQSLDNSDVKAGRIALRIDPTNDLQIVVRANIADGRSGGLVYNLAAVEPVFGVNGAPTFAPALLNTGLEIGSLTFPELLPFLAPSAFGPPTAADYAAVIAGQQAAYQALVKYKNQGYNVNYSEPNTIRAKHDGTSVNITYHINDDLSLKSITAYQFASEYTADDIDATPYHILEGVGDNTTLSQITQELQLTGFGLDRKLVYSTGLFYYYQTGSEGSTNEQELPFLNAAGSPVNVNGELTDQSEAVYGQATYAFTPVIHLTSGVRWTQEKTTLLATQFTGPTFTCDVPPPGGVDGAPCADSFSNKFRDFSYTAGLDWSPADDTLLYVKTSRGFKAGGQNQRGGITGGYDAFAPEHVTDYEIGEKSDFLAHRLRVNLAAYHSIYEDIQRAVLTETPEQQTVTEVKNAASATIDGVEAEITARPVPPLTLTANAAYTLPQYQTYISGTQNFSGHDFADQPLWQFNTGATYTADFNIASVDATLTSSVNFSYQTHVNLAPDTISVYSQNYPIQGGYGLLGARIALDVPKYQSTLELWGKNLTDRKYLVGTTDLTAALGIGSSILSDPRTFGFDIVKRF